MAEGEQCEEVQGDESAYSWDDSILKKQLKWQVFPPKMSTMFLAINSFNKCDIYMEATAAIKILLAYLESQWKEIAVYKIYDLSI